MFIDGLPIWGFIGKVEHLPGAEEGAESEKLSLFTHIHFDVLFNADRVIQVDISTGGCGVVRCGTVLLPLGWYRWDGCGAYKVDRVIQVDISTGGCGLVQHGLVLLDGRGAVQRQLRGAGGHAYLPDGVVWDGVVLMLAGAALAAAAWAEAQVDMPRVVLWQALWHSGPAAVGCRAGHAVVLGMLWQL